MQLLSSPIGKQVKIVDVTTDEKTKIACRISA